MSGVSNKGMSDYGRDMRKVVALTLEKSHITKENFADIETIDPRILAKNYAIAYKELGGQGVEYFGPTKSEDYLGDPFYYGFTDHAKEASLIVGSNFSEFTSLPSKYSRNEMTLEQMKQAIVDEYGREKAEQIIPEFQKTFPNNQLIDVLSYDRESLRKVVIDFVKLRAEKGCKATYCYHFNPIFRINDGCTALHSSDIVFVFDNIHMVPSTYLGEGVAERLQHEMAGRLLSFCKTDVPNIEDGVEWKPSTKDEIQTMVFAEECACVADLDKRLLEIMEGVKVFGGM